MKLKNPSFQQFYGEFGNSFDLYVSFFTSEERLVVYITREKSWPVPLVSRHL